MADESPAQLRPYLQEIAERLWRDRAAVMIGAGFSQNAEATRSATARLPNWGKLGDIFYRKLHGHDPGEGERYLSVLKLADQVKAALGKPALDNLLRDAIPDLDYEPSVRHRELLELPWKDVFTTNYDTLLERARASITLRHYELVTKKADLLYAKAPRIVKLHGTLPSPPFVITEEDYRVYPHANEPFVNTVRQSLLENTLCLIGFSGDDPNFLQWIGWIRDQVGKENAPKIYLVGVLNGLSEAEKKLLDARNIVVVDLAPFSQDHGMALAEFFAFLRGKKTRAADWPFGTAPSAPGSTALNAEAVGEVVTKWRQQRLSYPGWVVMPRDRRSVVWAQTEGWLHVIGRSTSTDRKFGGTLDLNLAYEIGWRVERCLCPLAGELSLLIERVVDKYGGDGFGALPKESCWIQTTVATAIMDMRIWLLRHYREEGSSAKWDGVSAAVEEDLASLSPEQKARFRLESALQAIFRFNPSEAKRQLMDWQTDQGVPFWEAKRAGLLAELGEPAAARSILEASLLTIRKRIGPRSGGGDYTLLSQESIVMLLLYTVERSANPQGVGQDGEGVLREFSDRWSELAKYKCDPRHEVELFSALLRHRAKTRERSRETNEFDLGHVSRHVEFGFDQEALTGFGLLRLCEDAGIPFRIEYASFVSGPVRGTLSRVAPYLPHWVFVNILRLGMAKLVDEVFDREFLAERTRDEIDGLVETYRVALERTVAMIDGCEWSEANAYSPLAKTLPEILSRLCYKCSPGLRSSLVDTLRSIYESDRRHLCASVRALRIRLFDSMSIQERIAAVTTLIDFPALENAHPADQREFVNPVVDLGLPESRYGDAIQVSRRSVDHLLGEIAGNGAGREWALTTVAFLQVWGVLTESESIRLGAAMWNELDGSGLPDVQGLPKSAFVQFPHPDNVDVERVVKTHLLRAVENEPTGSRWDAALAELGSSTGVVNWSESEVAELMAPMVEWWGGSKGQLGDPMLTPFGTLADMTNQNIGRVVNALSAVLFHAGRRDRREWRTEAAVKTFVDFVSDLRSHGIHATRLEVAGLVMMPDTRGDIVRRVASGLLDEDAACVADAVEATRILVETVVDERGQPAPGVVEILEFGTVVRRLAQGVEWRHAPALAKRLRAAAELVRTHAWALSDEDRDALVEGLGHIAEETSDRVRGNDDGGVILIRAASASLASALHWHFQTSGATVPRVIADWEVLCNAADEFAEVRNGWVEEGEA